MTNYYTFGALWRFGCSMPKKSTKNIKQTSTGYGAMGSAKRGTSNSNSRGSSYARKRRKLWLLEEFGDGTTAPCTYCGCTLTFETITVDRIIPGCEGGTYKRGNIQPSCSFDNSSEGGRLAATRRANTISATSITVVT